MKKGVLFTLGTVGLALVAVILIIMMGCSQAASTPAPAPSTAKPAPASSTPTAQPAQNVITLKAVTFLPRTDPTLNNFYAWVEDVKKLSNGRVVVDYKGGPEVIPPPQLGKALQDGVIDMAELLGGNYAALGVPDYLPMSQLSIEDEMKPGSFNDVMQEYHKKAGLYYMGRNDGDPNGFFYISLKKLIQKQEDFAGQKIEGIGTIHNRTVKDLGGVPLTIIDADLYTSLENGTADGFQGPFTQVVDRRFYEVLKYTVDHPFLNATAAGVLSLKAYNNLSPDLQATVVKAWNDELILRMKNKPQDDAKYRKTMSDGGMKFITLPPDVAKWWVQTAWDAEWKRHAEVYPDVNDKFKALLAKK